MPTKKSTKKRSKKLGFLGWLLDIFQILWDLLPMRAVAVTLLVGGMAGGMVGYSVGAGSAGCPVGDACEVCDDCETCEVCETCEECEDCEDCPVCPDCPDCPKALEEYTCSEISDARMDCHCVPV